MCVQGARAAKSAKYGSSIHKFIKICAAAAAAQKFRFEFRTQCNRCAVKVTMPSFSAALSSLLSGAPACSARPSEASSSRPHSLGVLSNTNFDRHGAMPSAVQFCCAKSRACAVIGMLAHGSAADIIKIDNDNLRKVRADLLSPSSASIATLFHAQYLLTSTPLDSVLALECQCICYICGCEHQVQ